MKNEQEANQAKSELVRVREQLRELRKEHGRGLLEQTKAKNDMRVAKLNNIIQQLGKVVTSELRSLKQQLDSIRSEVSETKFPVIINKVKATMQHMQMNKDLLLDS